MAAAPEQQSTVSQVASEAKTLVDKTAAELKPALDQAVHDKINPLAQDLAQKLQPITGDVSAHINTALADGVKQLNPIVDQASATAKGFVDDTAKQVRFARRYLKKIDGIYILYYVTLIQPLYTFPNPPLTRSPRSKSHIIIYDIIHIKYFQSSVFTVVYNI